MRFQSLASGSKGNCYYLASESGSFLIDCGISLKRLKAGVEEASMGGMEALQGIFITHEHRDHISGLGPLLRKWHLPVYGTEATLEALDERLIGKVDRSLFRVLEEKGENVADFHVNWERISHDAADPVSYQIQWGERKIGMLTDAGYVTDDNLESLYDCDVVLLEANHDAEMLRTGPYPASLKRRIAGNYGHLSNETCAHVLEDVIGKHTQHVVLAHLSEQNNHPQTAYDAVLSHLRKTPPQAAESLRLWVAQQRTALSIDLS